MSQNIKKTNHKIRYHQDILFINTRFGYNHNKNEYKAIGSQCKKYSKLNQFAKYLRRMITVNRIMY